MNTIVEVPIWALILLISFATITFFSHFLFPSVRWFFRKRMERVVARLNKRLERPIEPFKLARRHDTIQKLIYDTQVSQAISDYAAQEKIPENVAFEKARWYAREIVPSFSATAYFSIAMRFARWLSQSLYHVRIQHQDDEAQKSIPADAAVIYVMNHRSNMDYVLVTWLASSRTAMSYAVGEWARVWPLSRLIKAMGAYFIRRRSQNDLYRKVLARYVQFATDAGVTQAVFPEGGLSLTGALVEPKHGLMKYLTLGRSSAARDVVFVPVAINYDRVFEDRILINAAKSGRRRFPARIGVIARFMLRQVWQKLTGRFRHYGYAAVSFGTPLALSDFETISDDADVERLTNELMRRIGAEVPVLPVPFVSQIIREAGETTVDDIRARVRAALLRLDSTRVHLPKGDPDLIVPRAFDVMLRRNMIRLEGDRVYDLDHDLLAYYAASVSHLFADAASES